MNSPVYQYLKKRKISTPQDFVDTLNLIGPIIGVWAVNNPISLYTLNHLSKKKVRKESYHKFSIPKKSGGKRHIVAPDSELKNIQRCILKYLEGIFNPHESATGFVTGKSIRDNALPHIGKDLIVNIDLEDFFPSIIKKKLKEAFYNNLKEYIPCKEVANLICNLCTIPNDFGEEVLAQGAPTSPLLSNIVLKDFDRRVSDYLKSFSLAYTRYADDITISGNKDMNRQYDVILDHIVNMLSNQGLRINWDKYQIRTKGERKEVTGIVTNEKLNLPQKFVKQIRVLLHLWDENGYDRANIIYKYDFKNHGKGELRNVIKGKLNYMRMVKGSSDPTFEKLNRRYKKLLYQYRQTLNSQKSPDPELLLSKS